MEKQSILSKKTKTDTDGKKRMKKSLGVSWIFMILGGRPFMFR